MNTARKARMKRIGRDNKRVEAAQNQRGREDLAPRLRDVVAPLQTLRLRFKDARESGEQAGLSYAKPIMVANAPAHFEVCCMDKACNGRHDITEPLMEALHARQAKYAGRSKCAGTVNDLPCEHTLVYEADATYSR